MQVSRGRPISAVAFKEGTNVPDYRFELAPDSRTLCKAGSKACPGGAIQQGQLRLRVRSCNKGVPQEFLWKHFGCIRGPTWIHIQQHFHKASDLEGFATLPLDLQAKVRRAFVDGCVAYEDIPEGVKQERPQYVDLGRGIAIGAGSGSVDKGKRKAVEGRNMEQPSKKKRPSLPTSMSISHTLHGGQRDMLDTTPANAVASGSGMAESNASSGPTIESFGTEQRAASNQDSQGSSSDRRHTRSMGLPSKPHTQATLCDAQSCEPDTVLSEDEDDQGSSPRALSNSKIDPNDDNDLPLLGGGHFVNAFADLARRLRELSQRVYQGKIQLVEADRLFVCLDGYRPLWVSSMQPDGATQPLTNNETDKSGEELLRDLADKLATLSTAVELGTIDFTDARRLDNDIFNQV